MRQGRRLIFRRIPRVERFLHGIAQSYSKFGPRSLVNHEVEEFTVSIEAFVPRVPNIEIWTVQRKPRREKKRWRDRGREREREKRNKKVTEISEISPEFYFWKKESEWFVRNFPSRYADLFVLFEQWWNFLQFSYRYIRDISRRSKIFVNSGSSSCNSLILIT